jgi:hypothetical protein
MATSLATTAPPAIKLDTYRLLKLSRLVLLSLCGLLFLAILLAAQVHRDAMQTVGLDTVPSIIAAQHIKAALADMDADEANVLLAPPNTANSATKDLMRRRDEADRELLKASGNVTYDAERAPIETLQVTGGFYNRLAQEAEDLHDFGPPDVSSPDPHDVHTPPDVNYYQALAILMDRRLLPAAEDLDHASNVELQRTYSHQTITSNLTTALVAVVGLATLAALLWMQVFLSNRTHRTFNLPLLLATMVALFLFLSSFSAFVTEQHELKVAKEDSFESIHALWQARAVAYQANAEESRFLLDPRFKSDANEDFFLESAKLAKLPPGMSVQDLLAMESRGQKVEGFTGYLADELNNITFPGEREVAVKTLAAFASYLSVDAEIRRLENSGPEHHQDAVNLCVGSAAGQSHWAFAQFDSALGETLRINQEQFDRAVKAGLSSVGTLNGRVTIREIAHTMEFKAFAWAVVIAALIAAGLAPRIKEYE